MFNTMLVEDNVFFRESLRDGLQQSFPEMQITEAGDGLEALNRLNSLPPDLIFMDIRLPGENGLDLTEKIKTLYPDIRIIILTNYDIPEYRAAATQVKADYFFAKDSMTIDEVITLVKPMVSGNGFK